ncbi:hypothetical protein FSARC_10200 [Fusarium sarcochroum]|uniref:CHAT domain-containing protein n=1 Tax=Fusarium sarcochroum TaxID=1208366 RepID=A0A8H4X556_9HYPO|nr:hypothetical protein FSARC_10200 [Fusarium sarcochroum]
MAPQSILPLSASSGHSNKSPADKIENFRPGYPRFTALIAAHSPFFVFRRFSRLRARLLLLKQDRLSVLEQKLDQIDHSETAPILLGKSRMDRNGERLSVLSEIECGLADYDDFVEKTSRTLNFSAAEARDAQSLKNWLDGNGCLARDETAWLGHERDLFSLVPTVDNAVTRFENWIEDRAARPMGISLRIQMFTYTRAHLQHIILFSIADLRNNFETVQQTLFFAMNFPHGLFQPSQQATGARPSHPLAQVEQLDTLAETAFARYNQTRYQSELDNSIQFYRQAIACIPSSYPIERASLLNNLACRLLDRYNRATMLKDLDEACQALRQATEAAHPQRGAFLSNLGLQLGEKYDRTRETSLLDEAIRVSREAITCTPEGHTNQPRFLCNLANRLGQKYSAIGNPMDLEESIEVLRTANKLASTTHPDRTAILITLALQLGERYSWKGIVADLDEAIILARQAIDETRNNDPKKVDMLGTLADLLYYRFNRSGGISDLDEAIQKRKQVIHTVPKHQSGRAGHLSNLANLLLARNSRSGAPSDLTEAIEHIREAVDDTPENYVYRAAMLSTLATLLGTQASRTALDADLEEAIRVSRQAVQAVAHDRPERVRYLYNLAMLLGNRSSRTKTTVDLDEAIAVVQQAVEATPSDFPDRASLLNNLGKHLAESYSHTQSSTSLQEAKECLISALYHQPSPVQSRVTAGRLFLSLPGILEDLDQAYTVAKFTVDLVPLLNSPSIQHTDRQALLQQAVAIASDAAAIALMHGEEVTHAVELLETGRNIIASSLQDLRIDLFTLQEKHPDLASRFTHLRQHKASVGKENSAKYDTSMVYSIEADRQREAEEQLRLLLKDIRVQSGFEDFLLAPSTADLQAAAEDGPIAIINISQFRCDALIIELPGSRTVPLPAVIWDTIHRHDRSSLDTLQWLWDGIVSPVLDALGFTQQPADGHWPQIWWIPTGRLVGFPLHAAGYHLRQSTETALDRVVSSYSSSVKTIIHTRRQQGNRHLELPANQDLVLVSMQTTPGQNNLEHAVDEVQAIRKVVNSSTMLSPKEPLTFKKDVLSALRSCSIFHFAGHGETDPRNPLQSRLLLSDWQKDSLSVESVLETNLGREMPFLAYLSACGTSEIQATGLVDESIHMTTAFQLSGFQHVIGTLWRVNDRLCVDIAMMTYGGLLKGHMRNEAVSRSLHWATRELRNQWVSSDVGQELTGKDGGLRNIVAAEDVPVRPLWVPYIHYGI